MFEKMRDEISGAIIMCQICSDMQRLTKNPDYLCKSCAHAKQMDAMLEPYSKILEKDDQPYVEFSDEELE